MRRCIAGKCEVARVTVGSLGRSLAVAGKLRNREMKYGDLVRSYCCSKPLLTVGLRSLLRAGRDAPPDVHTWPVNGNIGEQNGNFFEGS